MPTKIIMTVDEDLTAQEVADLRYLLSDALGEFAAGRQDVDAYMAKRYPSDQGMGEKWLETKHEQVLRRVRLARKLHNAALGHEVVKTPLEGTDAHATSVVFVNVLRDYAHAHASYGRGGPAVTRNMEAALLTAVDSVLDAGMTLRTEIVAKREGGSS